MIYPGPAAEDLARIPQSLKAVKQWVLWRGVWRPYPPIAGQKPTKIPIDPHTLRAADTTDPLTWGTYDICVEALPVALEEWQLDDPSAFLGGGIGFVFTPDDPYAGVDLDGCVDPVTGVIADWAQEIVASLGSYAELSQSTTGLHVIIEGTLPPRGRRKGSVEMYDQARFFIMTGWHIETSPPTVEPRQTQLDNLWCTLFAPQVGDLVWTTDAHGVILNAQPLTIAAIAPAPFGELYAQFVETSTGHPLMRCEKASVVQDQAAPLTLEDGEIVRRIHAASNAMKVTALARGDWTQEYPSQSEADLALCCHFAFWTRDQAQIDRLFRTTGLLRDKWDAKRGAQTYGKRTVAEALARQMEYYTSPPTLVVPLPSSRNGQAHTWGTPGGRNGSMSEYIWGSQGRNVASPSGTPAQEGAPNVWARAVPAPAFAAQSDTVQEALIENLVVPQGITLLAAPRGVGKSMVGLALAIASAKGETFLGQSLIPLRVLLIDRDNSSRTIRRRLRRWDVEGAEPFKVLSRSDGAPSLLDQRAWQQFPVADYDLVIIDSFGAASEGVSETEGRLTQQAMATLKDLASKGPAILALDNTTKAGANIRGRGEKGDAVDIIYEVRDITGWTLQGEYWWEDLPEAGEHTWAQRASRHKQSPLHRLAFVPSKFRDDEPPDPFIVELDFRVTPWTISDVTAQLAQDAMQEARNIQAAQHDLLRLACEKLAQHLQTLGADGYLLRSEAQVFLQIEQLSRKQARNVLNAENGRRWTLKVAPGKGCPIGVYPLHGSDSQQAAEKEAPPDDPQDDLLKPLSFLAAPYPMGGLENHIDDPQKHSSVNGSFWAAQQPGIRPRKKTSTPAEIQDVNGVVLSPPPSTSDRRVHAKKAKGGDDHSPV